MSTTTPGRRPDWVDDELFPFESRFVELDGHHIHYVDEGHGPVLLMYHGNPTWSFLYRHLIAGLRDEYRCIAWDYPGFGLSSAAPGYDHSTASHADVAERFVEALDLDAITPVVQDWGGPIGLAAAVRSPQRYRALVIANTWAWPDISRGARTFSRIMGGPLGRALIERRNVFARRFVPSGHGLRKLSPAERLHYTAPFPDRASRRPVAVMPKEIRTRTDLLTEVADGLPRLAHLPALIVWGDSDQAFKRADRERWEQLLLRPTTVILEGAKHYVQDDAPDEIVEAIRRWYPARVEREVSHAE